MRSLLLASIVLLPACAAPDETPPPDGAPLFALAWTADEGEPIQLGTVRPEDGASAVTHVENVGRSNMAVMGILAPSQAFALREALPLWLAPGERAELTVDYQPTWPEGIAGFLSLRTQPAFSDPPTIAVRAQAIAPRLDWRILANLAESAEPGCSQEATLRLENVGTLPATIVDLAFEDLADFTVQTAPDLPFTLDPGARTELVVAFDRDTPGTAIDRVLLTVEPAYAEAPGPYIKGVAAFVRDATDTFSPAEELPLSEVPWPPGIEVQVDGQAWDGWTYAPDPPRLLIDPSALGEGVTLSVAYPVVEGC